MWALFAACQGLCQLIGAGIDARGIPPERISFPHALLAATGHDRGFHRPDGLCTGHVLAEILQPVFSVRGRPDRASLCKTKKTGSFLAREPGEPIAATVTRRIERHLIERLLRT